MVEIIANQSSINGTTLPPDMTFGAAQIISISAYTPLFLISAFLNLRILRKLWHTKQTNGLSRLNQLLMHLVLADLSIIWAITVSWWAGDFLCRVCSFFRIFGLFLSSNIVMCISIDRFLAILRPFSVHGSSRRIKVMLVSAWVLAVFLSLPQMVVFHVEHHPEFPWYEQCVTFGSFSSRLYEFLYFLMGMIFLYVLPLLVIIVTYGGIIIHLHKKSSPLTTCIKRNDGDDLVPAVVAPKWTANEPEEEDVMDEMEEEKAASNRLEANGPRRSFLMASLQQFPDLLSPRPSIFRKKSSASIHKVAMVEMEIRRTNPGVIGKAKLNTIKITIALVLAFLACWTPYYVMCIWFWADPDTWQKIDYSIRKFLFLFACTNSCANPLIYGAFTDRKSGIFLTKERICLLPKGRHRSKWNRNPLNGIEDGIELDALREDRRSKSFSAGSPNAYLKRKTVTAMMMRTELSFKERSFYKNDAGYEEALKKLRRTRSMPNLNDNKMSASDFNLVTERELHLKRNDFVLKVAK